VSPKDKPLAWLHGEIKTPPMSQAARLEAGYLLRQLQRAIPVDAAVQAYAKYWVALP